MKRFTVIIFASISAFLMGFTAFVLLPAMQLEGTGPVGNRFTYTFDQQHGRDIYVREGCVYCHTQQVRASFYGSDIERKWGPRGSTPADYIFDKPALPGKRRLGPDLLDVGSRLTDRDQILAHLYQPRAFDTTSVMPSYAFLFEVKPTALVLPSETVISVESSFAPGEGQVIVASEEALALSEYLIALKLE